MAGILDEPDNELYRLSKLGTTALLNAVNAADGKRPTPTNPATNPCATVTAYLDTSFSGRFLRSGDEIPYAQNANALSTYIHFLDSRAGAPHGDMGR